MRFIVLFILVIFVSFKGKAQTFSDGVAWQQSKLAEISQEGIEDLYLGRADCLSQSRMKADSLFKRLSLDTALVFLQSKSYTVRYYSFLQVLALDESLAFVHLKERITDSTLLDIRGACMTRTSKYNELLASEYKRYIYFKSKGQTFTIDGRTYAFNKSDQMVGKSRLKECEDLLKIHKVNTEF